MKCTNKDADARLLRWSRQSCPLLFAVLIGLCAALSSQTAWADAIVEVTFNYRLYRLSPRGSWINTGFRAQLKLIENGAVETELQVGRGKEVRKSRLGVSGNDPNTTYRVLNDDTIIVTRDFDSHVAVVTIYKDEQSCSASLLFHKKPGHQVLLLPSNGAEQEVPFLRAEAITGLCSIR